MLEKSKVLYDAQNILNKPDQPWGVSIEDDSIVATFKWMDATFFAPGEVNEQTKQYKFVVTLTDDGKWTEFDQSEQKEAKIDFKDNKISFGTSTFAGKQMQKSFAIGLGKNNQTGETGIISFKFDTQIIKETIRAYLKDCGYKKKGLFW